MDTIVRDAVPEHDFGAVAALLTQHGPEPVEAWELTEEHARIVPGKLLRRFVAERDGSIVGVATCIRFPSQPPALYHVHVVANPEGEGVGSALATRLEELLDAEPVEELWVDVREDRPRGLAFAGRHGFEERQRQVRAVLDLAHWRPETFAERIATVEAADVRVLDFATTAGDEGALRGLYEINRIAGLDDPSSAGGFPPFETWLRIVPESEGFDPRGQILAEAGGRFVGLAAVGRSGDRAWNAITGVAPEFRGRGIAQALKARAAEYAQQAGARRLETETNVENAPMRAINRLLGYRESPGYRTLARRLKLEG